MDGLVGPRDRLERPLGAAAAHRPCQNPLKPERQLAHDVEVAMGLITRKQRGEEPGPPIVADARQRVAEAAGVELLLFLRFREGRDAVEIDLGQARVAVHAVALAGDPVRPEVALLEHMDSDAQRLQRLDRRPVIGSAVAIEDDVGHAARPRQLGNPRRPVGKGSRVGDGPAAQARHEVATIDGDPGGLDAVLPEGLLQVAAKAAARHLQDQKCRSPPLTVGTCASLLITTTTA